MCCEICAPYRKHFTGIVRKKYFFSSITVTISKIYAGIMLFVSALILKAQMRIHGYAPGEPWSCFSTI